MSPVSAPTAQTVDPQSPSTPRVSSGTQSPFATQSPSTPQSRFTTQVSSPTQTRSTPPVFSGTNTPSTARSSFTSQKSPTTQASSVAQESSSAQEPSAAIYGPLLSLKRRTEEQRDKSPKRRVQPPLLNFGSQSDDDGSFLADSEMTSPGSSRGTMKIFSGSQALVPPEATVPCDTTSRTEARRELHNRVSRRVTRSVTRSTGGAALLGGPVGTTTPTPNVASAMDPPSPRPTPPMTPQRPGRASRLPRPVAPTTPVRSRSRSITSQSDTPRSRNVTPEARMGSQHGVQQLPQPCQGDDASKESCIYAKCPQVQTIVDQYFRPRPDRASGGESDKN
ncbi:hypothetical protein CEP54_013770 [Fusarium duplospermum]|uniref:Uncharacterized protein n=1 Tax=Fusarium duplospermum TaxID=1325734 RepID=A0A428P0L2_9HYPO|nr:hypothetical protein CEP54_013770 [Fusarium duplospermum]